MYPRPNQPRTNSSMANLASLLDHQAIRKPDHPAIVENGESLSCRDLATRVRQWAGALENAGLKRGDVIAVGLTDSADHIVMNWAVARMGAVILPVDHRWTDAEKANVINGFGAKALVSERGEGLSEMTVWLNEDFHARAAEIDPDRLFPEDADLPVVLSLSSGTTGRPKGPALSHRQMRARWVTQFVSLGFNEGDRYLSATPLYFGGGRSFTMSATWCGATVIMFPPPYEPQALISAAREHKATTTLLVPTILRRLLVLKDESGLLFPDLRLMLCTGSILHQEEREEVIRYLCPNFINYYGSTEGGGVSILTSGHGPEAAGSVGQVVFGTEVEIVDSDHNTVGNGQVGLIRYRGEGVAAGFYKDAEADRDAYHDGWFYPGDLGRFDEKRFLFLAGRSKDVIIRGGANIYPAEIESALLTHPDVEDAAVVGVRSKEMGEEIVAFVTGAADAATLDAYVRDRIASYKVPKAFLKLEALPKSNLGKIQKEALKESAEKFL